MLLFASPLPAHRGECCPSDVRLEPIAVMAPRGTSAKFVPAILAHCASLVQSAMLNRGLLCILLAVAAMQLPSETAADWVDCPIVGIPPGVPVPASHCLNITFPLHRTADGKPIGDETIIMVRCRVSIQRLVIASSCLAAPSPLERSRPADAQGHRCPAALAIVGVRAHELLAVIDQCSFCTAAPALRSRWASPRSTFRCGRCSTESTTSTGRTIGRRRRRGQLTLLSL